MTASMDGNRAYDACLVRGRRGVVGLLSRSLFEDSARAGGPAFATTASGAVRRHACLGERAWHRRGLTFGQRPRAYLGSIKEGLPVSVPETTSQEARQSLKERADGAARLLLADEDLARYVAEAFVAREVFTSGREEESGRGLGYHDGEGHYRNLFARKRI